MVALEALVVGGVAAVGLVAVAVFAGRALVRAGMVTAGLGVLTVGIALGVLAYAIDTQSWGLPRHDLATSGFTILGWALVVVGTVLHVRVAQRRHHGVTLLVVAVALGFLAYAIDVKLAGMPRNEPAVAMSALTALLMSVLGLVLLWRGRAHHVRSTAPPASDQSSVPVAASAQRQAAVLALGGMPTVAAGPFVPPTPEELAAALPQFAIEALIGSGGMGAVYRVRRQRDGLVAALKVLPRELAEKPGFQERFARESKALAGLSHPHVVTVHDAGQDGGWCWLLMELVEGANLREVMRTGRLSPEQALRLVPQLCEALQYAHDHGVVHRDIKPENILLDGAGRLKLTDFGLAKLLDDPAGGSALTRTGTVLGTVHYMAPEQVEGTRSVDHRADLYAVGVVLYEMLTGGLPLGRFQPPSHQIAVDVRVDEVVLKALEKDPERRYQHARDVRQDVERAQGGAAPAGAPVSGVAPLPNVWQVTLIAFLVLLAWALNWVLGGTATIAAIWWFYSALQQPARARADVPPRLTRALLAVAAVVVLLFLMGTVVQHTSTLRTVRAVAFDQAQVTPVEAVSTGATPVIGVPSSTATVVTSTAATPPLVEEPRPPMTITRPGTYHVLGGTFAVGIIEEKGLLRWVVSDETGQTSLPSATIRPGSGWFVQPEAPSRLWIYDGAALITLVEKTGPVAMTIRDNASEPGLVALLPASVRARLPADLVPH